MLRTECTAAIDIETWPLLMALMVPMLWEFCIVFNSKVLFQLFAELNISLVFVSRREYRLSFLCYLAYTWSRQGHDGTSWKKPREKWASDHCGILLCSFLFFFFFGIRECKTSKTRTCDTIKTVYVRTVCCHMMQ